MVREKIPNNMEESGLVKVALSFIAFLGLLAPLLYKAYKLKMENNSLLEKNKELKDKSIGVVMDFMGLNRVKMIVDNIFKYTEADRFLILVATNGKTDLRFATAIYEHHKENSAISLSLGAVNRYVEFEFDSHYLSLLKRSEVESIVDVNVDELPKCDIGDIYRSEGVEHAKWGFLDRKKIDDLNDRIFYCSVATHKKIPFSAEESATIKGYVGNIRKEIKLWK